MAPAMRSALTSCCKKMWCRMAAMIMAMNAAPQIPPDNFHPRGGKEGFNPEPYDRRHGQTDGSRRQRLAAAEGVCGINENCRKEQTL